MDYQGMIVKLQKQRDDLVTEQLAIDAAIKAIRALSSPKAPLPIPDIKKGRGRPKKGTHKANKPLPSDDLLDISPEERKRLQKKEQNRKYLMKRAARLGISYKPRGIKKLFSKKWQKNFDINREFDLGKTDIRMMYSYLSNWQDKMTDSQKDEFYCFKGLQPMLMNISQKKVLRELFYQIRDNVKAQANLNSLTHTNGSAS